MKLLEGLSLSEKQRLYYNGSHCPYCGNPTEYIDSAEVYQESYGMIHICRPCKAWVNVHAGSDQAFGFCAKKDLRELRHQVHLKFDPLWQKKVQMGGKKRASQAAARFWLAKRMNLDVVETHIGMFDNEQCEQAIKICQELYLTPEQAKQIELDIQYRIDTVEFLAGSIGFDLKSFKINSMLQMELHNQDGKTLYYHPKRKEARWSHKKKPFKVDDIEDFIIANFKTKEPCQK